MGCAYGILCECLLLDFSSSPAMSDLMKFTNRSYKFEIHVAMHTNATDETREHWLCWQHNNNTAFVTLQK